MSGIFGIVNFSGQPVSHADLESMLKQMAHRGPDAAHICVENDHGFGHLMLCSTQESLSEQLPWEDPVSGLLITADARIDNRDELFTALAIDSERAAQTADSQLILFAFRQWGEACVDHLLGDFSFAIWDKKNRQLFVARDHMGQRPFYYYCSGEVFVFASAANAITQVTAVPKRINEGRVADFLVNELEGINNTTTFFEQVYRMPPAHFGVVEKKKLSFQHYWTPDAETCLRLGSDDEYADALQEVLSLAVTARLRSQRPASAMLSGGIDSSAVCGIAGKLSSANGAGPFRTYSAVSEDRSNCCESGFIKQMIDHGGLDPVLINPAEVKTHAADFAGISGVLEDPFDQSWTLISLIYISAHAHGNIVVMDGIEGDLITGITTAYPAYLLRQCAIKSALHEINAGRTNYYEGEIGWLKAYMQAIRPALTPPAIRRLKSIYRSSDRAKVELRDSMLSTAFVKKIKLADRWQTYRGQSTSGLCSSLRQSHAERIVVPYLTAAIERYARLAGYCGVEARQPFHDKRVVELCLSMPWQQKAQNGWVKYCLRNVLQRVAPAKVAWRSEFDSIMWKFGRAWDALNRQKNLSTIAANRQQLRGMVDSRQLDQMLRRYSNGDAAAMEPIWNLVTLLNWLQKNQPSTRT